ncbi:D-glycerate dehydrogenase [bacterium]|nr:D-glycerate dehydrogenase [bacterium]
MKKVFITRKLAGRVEKFLREKKFNVKIFQEDRPIARSELLSATKNVDAMITLLTDKIDREVIDNLQNCKIIANCAVGYNNIDVEYARTKNIIVTNTPDILTDATADLTVALILACARRLREGELMMRSRQFKSWKPQMLLGLELKGKTVGIIGAGRIGAATAKRLKAFGTKFVYYDRNRKDIFDDQLNAKKVSLNLLLKTADIISVHLPLSKETFHLINKENLKLIKKTAVLVNTSRGEIIEEKALIQLLKREKIFAAGLDVYENEPDVNPELLKLNNVFLLPHIGSATIEARSGMAELCAKNVINVLPKKNALTPV